MPFSFENEALDYIEFGDAIRSGSIDTIKDILKTHGIEILISREIFIEVSFRNVESHQNVKSKELDTLWLTPFHLAILSRKFIQFSIFLQICKNN